MFPFSTWKDVLSERWNNILCVILIEWQKKIESLSIHRQRKRKEGLFYLQDPVSEFLIDQQTRAEI
jgi:hypothetical protein